MDLFRVVLALLLLATTAKGYAQVRVSPEFMELTQTELELGADGLGTMRVGRLRAGEAFTVEVVSMDGARRFASVQVVDELALGQFVATQRGEAARVRRAELPLRWHGRANTEGTHFLLIDSSVAAPLQGNLIVRIGLVRRMTDAEVETIRLSFEGAYRQLREVFDFGGFAVSVRPCGQVNAFSDSLNGNVTLCTELVRNVAASGQPGALTAAFLHEAGHSLLNLWGHGDYANEDAADEFATFMLMRTGPVGRSRIEDWIAWWRARSTREPLAGQRGDQHSLSAKRAENIRQALDEPCTLMRRWNLELYQRMTKQALEAAVHRPGACDDVAAAQRALARKAEP